MVIFSIGNFLVSCVVAPVVGLDKRGLSSVPSRSGEERVLRRTVGWFRARGEGFSSPACAETSLLHARRPSLWTPLGVIPVASGTVPSTLRDRAASDQGPRSPHCTYGVVAARRPPMDENSQPRTYRNLCCSWVRRLRAGLALYGL